MDLGRIIFFFSAFILSATLQACSQGQQVINSPCATVNATMESKQNVDLSLIFGNDAIRTALDTIARNVGQKTNASTTELTSLGTDAAVGTAEANGKILKPQDKTAMETYLRSEVVPAIRQNPTCVFNVSSFAKPYVAIDGVFVGLVGGKEIAQVRIKNTGQEEANPVHVALWHITDGIDSLRGERDMVLGPNQSYVFSVPDLTLPLSDVRSGKTTVFVVVEIRYVREIGSNVVGFREEWTYHPPSNKFVQVSKK